jgi:hypothetical protein
MDAAKQSYDYHFGNISIAPPADDGLLADQHEHSQMFSRQVVAWGVGTPGDVRILFMQANKEGFSAFSVSNNKSHISVIIYACACVLVARAFQ